MPDRHADITPEILWDAVWRWVGVMSATRRQPIDARMRAAMARDHFTEWGVRHA